MRFLAGGKVTNNFVPTRFVGPSDFMPCAADFTEL